MDSRERAREKAEIDASADAFLVAAIDERLQTLELVVVDGDQEFVDHMILENPVCVGQSEDGILRFQPADSGVHFRTRIPKTDQTQTHRLALFAQRGE